MRIFISSIAISLIYLVLFSSCCSGDDGGGTPGIRTRLLNADASVNLFSIFGPYEPDDLRVYLSDGVTLANFDPPNSEGTIPITLTITDSDIINGYNRTNSLFYEFDNTIHELIVDYNLTTDKCNNQEIQVNSFIFNGKSMSYTASNGGFMDLIID